MLDLPVLLVDDEPQVRWLLRSVLTKHGFQVLEARDAMSALETVRRLDGAISLVVSDNFMPEMNGNALALIVKEQFPAIPILLMSSEATACDCVCADAFLAKPFVPSVLVDTVRRLLSPREIQCG
jgi:DNA-binding NtrC family response regulator